MKSFVLALFSFLILHANAQHTILGSKKHTLTKKQNNANQQVFNILNTENQPFVAFNIKVNGKVETGTKVYLQYTTNDFMEGDYDGIPMSYFAENTSEKKDWKRDIHFDNTKAWSSVLEFLPANTKSVQVFFENTGNKYQDINFNFFYPNKTENIVENSPKATQGSTKAAINCACPLPALENRADWDPAGNHPAQTNPTFTAVTHLIVHHQAGSNNATDWAAVVRSIWTQHVIDQGWSDVGYNYLIDPNGVIYEGRGNDVLGAHFSGTNGGTMGVCLLGDYHPNIVESINPSAAMQNSLVELLSWKTCDISADPLTGSFHAASGQTHMHISGHRDGGATSCPGDNVYNLLPNIRATCSAYLPNCSFAANADLLVSALETSPSTLRIGENTTITVAVGNGGNVATVETINVELKIDGNLVNTYVFDSIQSGQILHFSEPNYVFSTIGNHQICVYIDSASNETFSANNSFCKTVIIEDSVIVNSDLLVQSIAKDISLPVVSEAIAFDFVLKNNGAAATSEAVQASIKVDGVTKQQFTIPIAAAAQSLQKNFNYTFSEAGNHSICLEINSPTNEIAIANNKLCNSFDVLPKSVNINSINQGIVAFEVYPNPAKDNFEISLSFLEKQAVNISLFNALGQKVYQKQHGLVLNIKESVNIKELSKGVYVLRLETVKGSTSKKVFVQ